MIVNVPLFPENKWACSQKSLGRPQQYADMSQRLDKACFSSNLPYSLTIKATHRSPRPACNWKKISTFTDQGPVVQSIVSLMSLLVIKMLTVLVSTISNLQVFCWKMWVAFAKATHIFFSKNISVYAIFNDQNFNDTLTNNIISFEQLDPGIKYKAFSRCV